MSKLVLCDGDVSAAAVDDDGVTSRVTMETSSRGCGVSAHSYDDKPPLWALSLRVTWSS